MMCACLLRHFSRVLLFATLWTVACQAPLSIGFSGQEYWSWLLCPPPGDLPKPGIELEFLMSPALAGSLLPLALPGKPKESDIERYNSDSIFFSSNNLKIEKNDL